MFRLTQLVIRAFEKITPRSCKPKHLLLGRRGETEAYFYLTRLGYRIVATNFRVPYSRGEIDLIGWDNGVLCFVEVKTRGDDSFAPPSSAVTLEKQRNIVSVATRYLRRLPRDRRPSCRFDVLSIVPAEKGMPPQFTLRRGVFDWKSARRYPRHVYDFRDRYSWRR